MKIGRLEKRILNYLESDEPYSTADQISEELKIPPEMVFRALHRLKKLGMIRKVRKVVKEDDSWIPRKVRKHVYYVWAPVEK
jgi:DNA-binding Lrp family transcriptional regulator